ncbi:MAG TPA: hypothetical protein VIK72_10485 [Clostridiaceae bacterium]
MLKLSGRITRNTRIIMDVDVITDIEGSYQDNLKECLRSLCEKMDISTPYWLPHNVDQYNKKRKTTFTEHNFIEKINFDKFIISETRSETKE